MLVGLSSPDDICRGDATVYGHSVKRDINAIRRSLGVCTQQDLLFPKLTVQEHIEFYSQLKVRTTLIVGSTTTDLIGVNMTRLILMYLHLVT